MENPFPNSNSRTPLKQWERFFFIPNLCLLATIFLYSVDTLHAQTFPVRPLIDTDKQVVSNIERLEERIARNPKAMDDALALAQLYEQVGEFPMSYDALRRAEILGDQDPLWRLQLGMAYINVGKNDDGKRVLDDLAKYCQKQTCHANLLVKLDLFRRVVALIIERKLDVRRDPWAAERAMSEIVKDVQVDMKKLIEEMARWRQKLHPDPIQPAKTN